MSVLAVNSASLSRGDCELYFLIKMLWLSIAEEIFLFSIIPFFYIILIVNSVVIKVGSMDKKTLYI